IVATNLSRRAAIVGTSGGVVVDWLLDIEHVVSLKFKDIECNHLASPGVWRSPPS
ncbi:hypothetical protein A2U01_0079075, partial [Trifolium medium]|nr:hypothetical protein [Trifolium medium]